MTPSNFLPCKNTTTITRQVLQTGATCQVERSTGDLVFRAGPRVRMGEDQSIRWKEWRKGEKRYGEKMKRKMEDHCEGDFRSKLKLIRNVHSPPSSSLIYFQQCYRYIAGQLPSETPADLGLYGWMSAPHVCSARWAGLVGGANRWWAALTSCPAGRLSCGGSCR